MYLRSILSGTLAVLFLSSAPVLAAGASQPDVKQSNSTFHLPTFGLPGVFGAKDTTQVQVAQAGTSGLEEQIRKQQEDNEFRFQELEGSGGAAQGTQKKSDAAGTPDNTVAAAPGGQSVEDVIIDSGTGDPGTLVPGTATTNGAPPKTFGTITVDKNGNVIDAGGNTQSTTPATPPAANAGAAASSGTVVAALPATDNPEELYRNSYQFILSGDYGTAEQGFREHIARFPKDAKASDAHYWLGESLLGQQKYRDAAEVFLGASKSYPKAKKAPDMLLKLGMSLVGLKQRDVACATFGEIGKRYPDISGALKERVKQERALASC